MAKQYSGQMEAQRERAEFRTGLLPSLKWAAAGYWNQPTWRVPAAMATAADGAGTTRAQWGRSTARSALATDEGGGACFGFAIFLMCVGGLGLPSLRLAAGNLSTSTAQTKGVDLRSRGNTEGKHSFSGQITYFPFLLTNLWQILRGLWALAPGLLCGSLQMCLE